MCSASERDEMFLVVEKWEYELPKDWQLLQTEHFSKKYTQESVNAFLKTL